MSSLGVFIVVNERLFEVVNPPGRSTACIGCDLSDVQEGASGGCMQLTEKLTVSRDTKDSPCTIFKETFGFSRKAIFKEVC